ncbi:hypothetical protein L6Q79_02765 [bacterium]|nr:hypothetical protein [bacterium]NUN44749.1 hypothetical protein [bacterium]
MTKEDFVKNIKTVVRDSSINGTFDVLQNPPGIKPAQNLIEISRWYNKLGDSDKQMLRRIVEFAIDGSIFDFFCVLDGVAAIEDTEEKGTLELYFVTDYQRELLNDDNTEFLHDLYRYETQ